MIPVINYISGIDAAIFWAVVRKLLYFIIISVRYQIKFLVENTVAFTTREPIAQKNCHEILTLAQHKFESLDNHMFHFFFDFLDVFLYLQVCNARGTNVYPATRGVLISTRQIAEY